MASRRRGEGAERYDIGQAERSIAEPDYRHKLDRFVKTIRSQWTDQKQTPPWSRGPKAVTGALVASMVTAASVEHRRRRSIPAASVELLEALEPRPVARTVNAVEGYAPVGASVRP